MAKTRTKGLPASLWCIIFSHTWDDMESASTLDLRMKYNALGCGLSGKA